MDVKHPIPRLELFFGVSKTPQVMSTKWEKEDMVKNCLGSWIHLSSSCFLIKLQVSFYYVSAQEVSHGSIHDHAVYIYLPDWPCKILTGLDAFQGSNTPLSQPSYSSRGKKILPAMWLRNGLDTVFF